MTSERFITPAAHAVIDYAAAGAFVAMGWGLLGRNRRAAQLAFVHAAAVVGLSLLTDYPGGVFRKLSFRTHGAIDVLQAGMTAITPTLFGFASTPEAQLFHGQAMAETAVVAATDWGGIDGRLIG